MKSRTGVSVWGPWSASHDRKELRNRGCSELAAAATPSTSIPRDQIQGAGYMVALAGQESGLGLLSMNVWTLWTACGRLISILQRHVALWNDVTASQTSCCQVVHSAPLRSTSDRLDSPCVTLGDLCSRTMLVRLGAKLFSRLHCPIRSPRLYSFLPRCSVDWALGQDTGQATRKRLSRCLE